jgi:hypothetical protein
MSTLWQLVDDTGMVDDMEMTDSPTPGTTYATKARTKTQHPNINRLCYWYLMQAYTTIPDPHATSQYSPPVRHTNYS